MASSFMTCAGNSLLFFGLLLLARSCQLSARPLPTNDLIGEECRWTDNMRYQEIVNAMGVANTADLLTLVNLTVSYAYSVSNETYHYIEDLAQCTKDPALNGTYSTCLSMYDSVVGALADAREYLRKRDYNSVSVMASGARTLSLDCGQVLTREDGSWRPPPDLLQLSQKNSYCTDVLEFPGQISYDLNPQ